jgi:hypothetical protein
LSKYLQNTNLVKTGGVSERVDQLLRIHHKFIDNVRNKMSVNEIAKRLFTYEKNLNKEHY